MQKWYTIYITWKGHRLFKWLEGALVIKPKFCPKKEPFLN